METSQHRIETGSNYINPHKRLISFGLAFWEVEFKDGSSGLENSAVKIRKYKP